MASMEEKYDNALIGILQNEGQIAKFLDVLLGFLYRRTDFYRIMHSENDKLGFPPGVAMKLLVNIFKKYESLAAQDEVKRQKLLQDRAAKAAAKEGKGDAAVSTKETPAPLHPRTTETTSSIDHQQKTEREASQSTEPKREPPSLPAAREAQVTDTDDGPDSKAMDVEEERKDPKDEEEDRLQKEFQANPESYNGAVRDNYSWSQSITDVDVKIKVPNTIKKGKDMQVDIRKKHLSVRYRGAEGEWELGVDGELTWEVKAEDCMWTLSPGQHVQVNLEKKQERWWEAVFVDEPKINTRKIDCSRPLTDLDDEAQAKIEEMMYNERQKRLGLPQSHEQKTMDMLKQAWEAEGSPFKGQQFDPSAISIDPSGVVKMK